MINISDKKHSIISWSLVAIGFALITFCGFGLLYPGMVLGENIQESVVVCDSKEENTSIVVSVVGAVKNPGVYEMKLGARLAEAIETAGGFDESVDKGKLIKSLNLARELKDEEQIVVSEEDNFPESDLGNATGWGGEKQDSGSVAPISKMISINNASQQELETLDSIGEKRAQAIIEGRPYGAIEELVERGVLGKALFEEIKSSLEL